MDSRDNKVMPLGTPLSPREREVLKAIGRGLSNREIAEEMVIALTTVKWYVRQIYNKLGVDDRAGAIARAQKLQLIPAGADLWLSLPLPATPFVGRAGELAALDAFLDAEQVRVITVVGPGGMGKTRLVLEAARRKRQSPSRFADGIFFISLAPLESAEQIVSRLAATVGLQLLRFEDETEQLLNYLRRQQMLLVMDNFEQVADARALLAEIISGAPHVKLLVTSRDQLQLRAEQLFPLSGLGLPPAADDIARYPAAELFLDSARRASPDFYLQDGDAQHLLHICRLVGGMPLALELAASWVALLPLAAIAAEIEQDLSLLASDKHDVPERQRSMLATLDTSWRRLEPDRQRAFSRLSIFRGGFTRMAAGQVAGVTLPILRDLVNRSWLVYDREADRYGAHELLRQYAAARLGAEPAQEQEMRAGHAAFFCGYLQEREGGWFGPRQKETATEIDAEIDNIRRAWRWAAGAEDDVLLAQGLHSLCRFYLWEGRLRAARGACQTAVAALAGVSAGARPQKPALLAQVLAWQTLFETDREQNDKRLAQSQALLDLAAAAGVDVRAEQAFVYLVCAYKAAGRHESQALTFANQARDLFRDLGHRWGEAEALAMAGSAHNFQGSYAESQRLLRASLEIREQIQDAHGLAEDLNMLGILVRHQGHFEEAVRLQQRGLELMRQLDNRFGAGSLQAGTLAISLAWAGRFAEAKDAAVQGLRATGGLGHGPNPAWVNSLTLATVHLGDYAEAAAIAGENRRAVAQGGVPVVEGFAALFEGQLAFVQDDLDLARQCLEASAAILRDLTHVYRSLPQATLGYVCRAEGRNAAAHDCLVQALRSGLHHQSISPIVYCLPLAALLAADEGNSTRAMECYGLAQTFDYITHSRWFHDVSLRRLNALRAALPPDEATAAESRGRETDVWAMAALLVDALEGQPQDNSSYSTDGVSNGVR